MWVKLAILLLGVLLLGGAVQKYGLPGSPAKQAAAPSTPAPAPPATPPQAPPQQQAAVPPATPAPAPASPAAPAAPAAPAPSTPSAPADAAKPAEASGPSFDIVRVEPDGTSVVAGRAAPGTRIELLLNGAVHDSATTDRSGQFALVPPRFPAGNHELTLAMVHPDGRREVSRQTVTMSIPDTPAGEVIVALAQPDKPTELLSKPKAVASAPPANASGGQASAPAAAASSQAAAPSAGGPRARIVVTTVEAEDSGRLYATGQAAGNATVRLYLNETFLATARAGGDGRWSFTIGRGLEPGAYRVRLDDVDPTTGSVLSRAEVPFTFSPRVASAAPAAASPSRPAGASQAGAPGAASAPSAGAAPSGTAGPAVAASNAPNTLQGADAVVPEIRSTMVSRGDSLWRISRRVYGRGMRYTVIYEANVQQIRDPKLIYPGQMFVLPSDKQP